MLITLGILIGLLVVMLIVIVHDYALVKKIERDKAISYANSDMNKRSLGLEENACGTRRDIIFVDPGDSETLFCAIDGDDHAST